MKKNEQNFFEPGSIYAFNYKEHMEIVGKFIGEDNDGVLVFSRINMKPSYAKYCAISIDEISCIKLVKSFYICFKCPNYEFNTDNALNQYCANCKVSHEDLKKDKI